MEHRTNELAVVLQNSIVHATLNGNITEQLIFDRHARVLALISDSGSKAVLYNLLAIEAPSLDLVELQHTLNAELQNSMSNWRSLCWEVGLPSLTDWLWAIRIPGIFESVSDALQWLQQPPLNA